MSHIERQRSLHEHGNAMDSPLQLFSKAKSKINKTFQEIAGYLEEASSFLEEKCYISEEFVNEVDKSSNEVNDVTELLNDNNWIVVKFLLKFLRVVLLCCAFYADANDLWWFN